jgi:hypothetical protein
LLARPGETATLALTFAGYEHAEVLHAAAIYLHDNGAHVAALFANDQEIMNWVVWVMQKLRNIEILVDGESPTTAQTIIIAHPRPQAPGPGRQATSTRAVTQDAVAISFNSLSATRPEGGR